MNYCLDTNVFITPSNLYYPMDFSPAYWDMIDKYIASGSIFIIEQVYQELTKGKSDVCDWIKERKADTFVKEFYDEDTQKEFRKIANICDEFDVKYINDFAMIRELKVKFVLDK